MADKINTEEPTEDEQDAGWIELLQADTPDEEVHQRPALGKGGIPVIRDGQPLMLKYVTARYVQDRLDTAVGPTRWSNVFESLATGAVRCGISILPPGSDAWITKWDVGVPTSIEADKGAHSDAFKRAAVQWGIARDLYDERDEDRLLSAPPAQAQTQPAPSIQSQVLANEQVPVQAPVAQYSEEGPAPAANAGTPKWVCPLHDDMRIIPAGISKRTGRQYNAFYACPVAGCDQKGPSA